MTAKEISALFDDLCKAIPPRKIGEQLYNINEISLWLNAKAREEAAKGV